MPPARKPKPDLSRALQSLLEIPAGQFSSQLGAFLREAATVGFGAAAATLVSTPLGPAVLAAALAAWGFRTARGRAEKIATARKERAEERQAKRLARKVDALGEHLTDARQAIEVLSALAADEAHRLSEEEASELADAVAAALGEPLDQLRADLTAQLSDLHERVATKDQVDSHALALHGLVDRMPTRVAEELHGREVTRTDQRRQRRHEDVSALRAHVLRRCQELSPYQREIYVDAASRSDLVWVEPDVLAADGPMPAHEPVALPILLRQPPSSWFLAGQGHRWLLVGDPGSGKTTLLRRTAIAVAEEVPKTLPLVFDLDEFARASGSWPRLLEMAVRHDVAERIVPALEALRDKGELLVLLDGLDEVAPDRLETLRTDLATLADQSGQCPVVVATRPFAVQHTGIAGFRVAHLQPLEEPHQHAVLNGLLGRFGQGPEYLRASEWLALLRRHPDARKLCSNPFWLEQLALLIREGRLVADRLVDHTAERRLRRHVLYDDVLDLILDGKTKKDGHALGGGNAAVRALERLARDLTGRGRRGATLQELQVLVNARRSEPEIAPLWLCQPWGGDEKAFLREVERRTRLVSPGRSVLRIDTAEDAEHGVWRFWHRTYQEALAARDLEREWKDDARRKQVLEQVAGLSKDSLAFWSEPFALLAGRIGDEPDELLLQLADRNQALALHALAGVGTVRRETYEELLNLSYDLDEKQRGELIRRVPQLVGVDSDEGHRAAVQLLTQAGIHCRSGSDVWFADETLREIAEDSSFSRLGGDACEAARVAIYQALPPPDAESLLSVALADGQRLPLWTSIAGGRFTMGNLKGGRDDERPAHAVHVPSIVLMTVPVTQRLYSCFDPRHKSPWEDHEDVPREELGALPATEVSWWSAAAFCRWMSLHLDGNLNGRLPTESEWEYACRADTTSRYWSGNRDQDLARVGWYGRNSCGRVHAVGQKPASPLGLLDMHGNVWEWVQDCWSDTYRVSRLSHPGAFRSPDPLAASRVCRGGAYFLPAKYARSACRRGWPPSSCHHYLGFRVARATSPE